MWLVNIDVSGVDGHLPYVRKLNIQDYEVINKMIRPCQNPIYPVILSKKCLRKVRLSRMNHCKESNLMSVKYKLITKTEMDKMCAEATLLEGDADRPRVLLGNDNNVIKIFRRRRLISSDRLVPYATRFEKNARKLIERGIHSPRIHNHFILAGTKEHVLVYEFIPGTTIRSKIKNGDPPPPEELAAFLATLHEKGIYFRALHMGNILKTDSGMALIDITDLRFKNHPLGLNMRIRNIRHALAYQQDWQHMDASAKKNFFTIYAEMSNMSQKAKTSLLEQLKI